ncbi:MAG: SgcJ/EcaC family oxidoreductase [Vicinamibacterales bacterium]
MKGRIKVSAYWILAIVIVAASSASLARAQAAPDAEFKKLADAFVQGWAKGDAKAIVAVHTSDAVRLGGAGTPVTVGSAAIEAAMNAGLSGPYKGTILVITAEGSKQVAPNTYVGYGTYQITGGAPPPGAPVKGQYMNTMVRQQGRWLIAGSAVVPETPVK